MSEEEGDWMEFDTLHAYPQETYDCRKCGKPTVHDILKIRSVKSGAVMLDKVCTVCYVILGD